MHMSSACRDRQDSIRIDFIAMGYFENGCLTYWQHSSWLDLCCRSVQMPTALPHVTGDSPLVIPPAPPWCGLARHRLQPVDHALVACQRAWVTWSSAPCSTSSRTSGGKVASIVEMSKASGDALEAAAACAQQWHTLPIQECSFAAGFI